MFWDPNEETRKTYMVSIIRITRELGLYKDNYSPTETYSTIDNESEDNDFEPDEAPVFLGDKAFVLKRRRQHNQQSLASLIDNTKLQSSQVVLTQYSSHVDDVTSNASSRNEGAQVHDEDDEDEQEQETCQCGERSCKLKALKSMNVQLKPCSNGACTSGEKIFRSCSSNVCKKCYIFNQKTSIEIKNENKKKK